MMKCEARKNDTIGSWLEWSNGMKSFMPDEESANKCAAAPALYEALEEFADVQDCTCVDLETQGIPGKCRVCKAIAALSLALNGPAAEKGKGG